MKSILIKDTTISERIDIVRQALDFGDGECEGVDMEDMYDDYIYGRKELAEINLEFSKNTPTSSLPAKSGRLYSVHDK